MRRDLPDSIDLSNIISIYKGFKFIGRGTNVEEFRWTRRFSSPGEFEIRLPFSAEHFSLYERENIIYRRDIGESAFVENIIVLQDLEGRQQLIVRGRFLSSIFERRVVNIPEGSYTPQELLQRIMHENFLAGAGTNRSMEPLVRLLPFDVSGEPVRVDVRGQNASQLIRDTLEENDLGVRVLFNIENQSYDVEFYPPVKSRAKFSFEWNNVKEQEFYSNTQNYRNVVLVGDNFIMNNHIQGMERREVFQSLPRDNSAEYLERTARDALHRYRPRRTLTSSIDAQSLQFEYETDWTIGSVVLMTNRDLAFSHREIIIEILEYFDEQGRHFDITTGDIRKGER